MAGRTAVIVSIVSFLSGCAPEDGKTEEKIVDRVHDVFWNGGVIPPEGGNFVFYNKLPDDQVYHATKFSWSKSTNPYWYMAMMFTISDEAVDILSKRFDLSKRMSSDAFMMAMNAGGYMLFQQGGEDVELPEDWGFLVGKGTARRHAIIRWTTLPSPDGKEQVDHDQAGFRIHLTTNLRKVNVGEAKFATIGGGGADTISVPPGRPAFTHIVQCTAEATNQIFRGDGVEILKVKPMGPLGYHVRITEAKGGGRFSRSDYKNYEFCSLPHHGNLLLEDGDFQEIFSLDLKETMRTLDDAKWYDVKERVVLKNGNSYRAEITYNSTGLNYTTIQGGPPKGTGYDIHFYYKEIPGNNEPFPGYCMDRGPWFMRTHNIDRDRANQLLDEWREDPSHGVASPLYGC